MVPGSSNRPVSLYSLCADSLPFPEIRSDLFEGYIALLGQCSDFRFSFYHCCVTPGTNYGNLVTDSLSTEYYNEATLNNTSGENNSPVSLYGGPRVFCVNQNSYWSHAVIETDQDSVQFEYLAPFADSGRGLISWKPGFSKIYPLNVANYFFNDKRKYMQFSPVSQGYDRLRLRVSEWRFDTIFFTWLLVGQSNLDLHVFYSASCGVNQPITDMSVTGDTTNALPVVPCGTNSLEVELSVPVLCGSIAADGSDFALHESSGSTLPVIGASGNFCGTDFFSRRILLQLFMPLQGNDTLTLVSRYGRDGNTLITYCGDEISANQAARFYVDECDSTVYLGENTSAERPLIYPNPCFEKTYIEFPDNLSDEVAIQLLNILGETLLSVSETEITDNKYTLELTSIPSGNYIIEIRSGSLIFRDILIRQ